MAFCTKCGHPLSDTDRFCANCGAAVSPPNSAAPQPASASPPVSPPQPAPMPPQPASPPQPAPGPQPPPASQPVSASPPGPAPQQPVYPNGYVPPRPPVGPGGPMKKKNSLLPIFIALGAVAAAVIIIALVIHFMRQDGGEEPPVRSMPESSVSESSAEASPTPDLPETVYSNHLNSDVSFSIDYPEGYTLSEPNLNNVLIGDGGDFRVAAEYAFTTQSNGFIYSAADFAAQIDANPQVLSDYVGGTAKAPQRSELTIDGADAYCYAFDLDAEDGAYQCALYLVEGKGDFGCYTIQTACRVGCDKADLYMDQTAHMVDSFQVTGAFENPDFTVYRFPDMDGLTFAVRNEAAAKVENHGTYVYLYPVEGKTYSARLEIRPSKWSAAEDLRTVLEELTIDGLSVANGGHSNGFPEPKTWPVGRYEFTQMDTEYIRDDERFTHQIVAFPHGGVYWYIRTKNLAEYTDAIQTALSDVIFSLDFLTDAGVPAGSDATPAPTASPSPKSTTAPKPTATPNPVDLNWAVTTIMGNIGSNVEGYVDDPNSPNKISVTDLDGDGCYEVLALYRTNDSMVRGEFVSIQPDGSFYGVSGFTIFKEVGGNDGYISLAKNNSDTLCVHLYEKVQNGTGSRDLYDKYYPLVNNEMSLNDKAYFETYAHGVYNSQMQISDEAYYIDNKEVSYEDYFSSAYAYTDTVTLKPYGDNLGQVMTFAEAQTYDFNGALLK